jgi:hypothetical protein
MIKKGYDMMHAYAVKIRCIHKKKKKKKEEKRMEIATFKDKYRIFPLLTFGHSDLSILR